MKITAVRTHLLEHRLATPFESASMRFDRRAHVLVEIECDDGTVGWGECLGPARPNAAVVQAYSGWLIGGIPARPKRSGLCFTMPCATVASAASALQPCPASI